MNQIIFVLIGIFAVIGGLDYVLGNRFGLGHSFEEGLLTMGKLTLTMAGIIVLAPVLAEVLTPVVVPVYTFLGADPGIFAGSLLASDMGGAAMARELANSKEAASLGGILAGAMLGSTVSFTLPVSMDLLSGEDRLYASKGILCGILTIPVGVAAGGLMAGFSVKMLISNLVPIFLMAGLIALGLWKAEKWLLKGFAVLGKGICVLAVGGLVLAGLEQLTGVTVIQGMAPLHDAFIIVGEIAVVLMGALPLLTVLNKVLQKPLNAVGDKLKINSVSVSGLIANLANSIPMFGMIPQMDARGKVVNMAFAVSAAFVFGDHMAFTAGFEPEMVPALIVGKLVGGFAAVAVALLLTRNGKKRAQ